MAPEIFTMKDVHKCYPWISSTTLYDRITSDPPQIPTKYKKGGGGDIELELVELVHIGVDDEMAVLGARQNLKQVAQLEFYFAVPPDRKNVYDARKPQDSLREPLHYCQFFNFDVRVKIDVLHPVELAKKSRRHKRSKRIYRVTYYPDPTYHGHYGYEIPASETVGHNYYQDGSTTKPASCFSSAVIDVYKIYRHCLLALGLAGLDMERFQKAMSEAARQVEI